MFTVRKVRENRLDIELAGKLDAAAMKTAMDALCRYSQGIRHGKLLYEVNHFDFPTFGALLAELGRVPEMIAVIKRFDRVAVLADERWLKVVSQLEDKLIPNMNIRTFCRADKSAAERWLDGAD